MSLHVNYYSQPNCSVCVDLKPRLREAITSRFPSVIWNEINVREAQEMAAAANVFTVPVVTIVTEGKEYDRFVRVFAVDDVINRVQRLHQLMNEE